MSGGEWTTQRQRKQNRDDVREARRRLLIEWADKYWLAQNHPVSDSVLAWLAENRADASKIGSSRWHLEILPALINRQHQLRTAEDFQRVLDRCAISTDSTESQKVRAPRKDRGKARKRPRLIG